MTNCQQQTKQTFDTPARRTNSTNHLWCLTAASDLCCQTSIIRCWKV